MLTEKIEKLKKEKDAVILAHYYVNGEVQEIADYIGDSYYLSKIAAGLHNSTIVFCGVKFMGESAKILSPQKTVLMPDFNADCPMAHMATAEQIEEMRRKYDDLAVVCYINSTAELKKHSDACVTSANALKIVKALPNKNILFIPDKNLGGYIAQNVPEKNFYFLDGACPVHDKMLLSEALELKEKHPSAKVLTHPECRKEIAKISDYVGSTSGIINFTKEDCGEEFIICTEEGVLHKLKENCPNKKFYFTKTTPVCADMKLITLEKIARVLETGENSVEMDENTIKEAKHSLERMLEMAK